MSNQSRPPARTPSIAIPSTGRSIDDILNINSLGAFESSDATSLLPQTHRYRSDHTHSPTQSRPASRSLYGALEAGRPSSSMRHASASTSLGSSRHALGGGSGGILGSRAASYSSRPPGPSSFNSQDPIATFEPRIIGGSSISSEVDGALGGVSSSRIVPRAGLQASRPRRLSQKDPHPPGNVGVHYGFHITGSGPPIPFKRPSYLQYSFFKERLVTDITEAPAASPGKVSLRMEGPDRNMASARARPPASLSERWSSSQTAFEASSSVLYEESDPNLYLPTKWSEDNMLKFLHISEDGRNLYFQGPTSQGEKDAAAARADRPIPTSCGVYYYEVTIIDKGQKGHISVGFSHGSVRLNRLPGWEKNSWGYHGDDGNSFASEKEGSAFGPRFSTKDVIGCGIDFSVNKAFYTKNGSFIGYAFDNIGVDNVELYPSVGLRTQSEAVRVNFGQEPFKYDIDYYVLCARDKAWARIQSTPVKWTIDQASDVFQLQKDSEASADDKGAIKQETADEEFTPIQLPPDYSEPIVKLIQSYLQHHGYERTSRALATQVDERRQREAYKSVAPKAEDVDIKMETDDTFPNGSGLTALGADAFRSERSQFRPEATQQRRQVVQAISTADIDQALKLLQTYFPAVLEIDAGFLLLKLKCRKFVEHILRTSEANKIAKNEVVQTTVSKPLDSVMDVDEDIPISPVNGEPRKENMSPAAGPVSPRMRRSSSRTAASPAQLAYQSALSETLAYGRALHKEVHESNASSRREAQELLKMTFSLVSYDDPLTAGGAVQVIASDNEREKLAIEVNEAILESQGRPSRPALERIYRQTDAVMTELALLGVGDAAFADMESEFLGA